MRTLNGAKMGPARLISLCVAVCIGFLPPASAETMSQGFVNSGGERIYYETVGDGPAVVFCHGLGGNHAIWYQQVPVFAEEYRVVTWDQRGFGRSTNEQGMASPATAANDLLALLDHLGIEQAHLVGQSMGGWAVIGFAIAYPERVASLVLADTIGGIYTPETTQQFDAYIRTAMAGPSPDEMPMTQHPALGDALGKRDPAQALLYRQIASVAGPPPQNMGLLLRQTQYPLAEVKAIAVPTLFVVGEDDPIFHPASIQSAAKQIPGSIVKLIPEAGHSPYFETPVRWNETVKSFLKNTGGE